MKLIIFALVAISIGDACDPSVQESNIQTIGYYSTIAECHTERNRIEPTINKSFVKLDCVPIKISE
jgi:hypothetical protein